MKNLFIPLQKITLVIFISVFLFACGGESNVSSFDQQAGADNIVSPVNTTIDGTDNILPLGENDSASVATDGELVNVALPEINKSKDRVSFSYVLLEKSSEISTGKTEYTKASRSFEMEVSGSDLSKGMMLPISSESPIIRVISKSSSDTIDKSSLQLNKGDGWLSAKEAFDVVVDKNELNAVGLTSINNTLAMKVNSSLGKNALMLKATGIRNMNAKYSVHVLESKSNKVLNLNIANTKLFKGDFLTMKLDLAEVEKELNIESATAFVRSPQGLQDIDVPLVIEQGKVRADIATGSFTTSVPGLWELHVQSSHGEGEGEVLRNAKVAFSLSPKTARFNHEISFSKPKADTENLRIAFNVEVAVAGRYEVSAVIYGADDQNSGIMAATAQWLDANGEIVLEIPEDKLDKAGISAPYAVRHLRLKDQSRMSELWSQEKALVIH